MADDLPYLPRGPGVVQLWDTTTLRKLASFEGHTGPIEALAFSPDGTLLASAGEDATTRLWDVKAATHLHTFEGHDKPLSALAFDRTGQRLATGGRDGSLRLWDVANRTAGRTFEVGAMPNPSIQIVDFHPDGTAVVLSDGNGQVGIRDLHDGKLRRMIALPVPAKRVYFHGDGGSLLIQESGVSRWDANTGTRLATEVEFPAMPALPGVPRVAPTWAVCSAWQSGMLAAQIGLRLEVVAVGRPPEQASWTMEKSTGYAPRAVLDGSGQVPAVTRGNKIFLCDPQTGAVRHTLAGHLYLVGGLAISPDTRTLASSSVFQGLHPQGVATPHDSIRLWDMLTGESLGQLQLPDYRVPAIAFSPDGSSLAALVHDVDFEFQAGVRGFDMKTRTQRLQLKHDHERTTEPLTPRLVYHPSGDRLVSVFERNVYVWNLTTGERERTLLHGLPAAKTQIGALAISPDGKTLVVARQEVQSTELQEWDLATGTMTRRTRPGPDMVVTGMVFSPDGKNLLTSGNGRLWIRDAVTMKVRTSAVVHGRWEVALAFGPGARTLVTAGTKESVSNTANVDLIQTAIEIKLWDVGPTPTRLVLPRPVYQGSMRFDPTGTRVIESDQSGWLRLWDVEKAELLAEFDGTRDSIGTLFSPDGRTLIGADTSGNLTLWDIESRSLRRIAFARGTPGRPAVSRDGSRVAILTGDRPRCRRSGSSI